MQAKQVTVISEEHTKSFSEKDPLVKPVVTPVAESEEADNRVLNADELIDMNTFDQLLDMDDEDDHEFSHSIVLDYFKQAETTFEDMDIALEAKNLRELSRLGHFLKGSSAAIGLRKVKATCEKIQNIGNCKDGENVLTVKDALSRIIPLLPQVKAEYFEAEEYLKTFYEEQEGR
ncbi:signal transduction histidine kinase [Phycomyces blakesleeanus]